MNLEKLNAEAKEKWGDTTEFKQFETKNKNRSESMQEELNNQMMKIFEDLGSLKQLAIDDNKVQSKIKELQDFITNNYYDCNDAIFSSLGKMYVIDERFKNNIDKVGGEGAAKFVSEAIAFYISNK